MTTPEATTNDIDNGVRFSLERLKPVIEPLLLISALSALLSYVTNFAFLSNYLLLISNPLEAYNQIADGGGVNGIQIFFVFIVNSMISIMTYVLLSRLVIAGRDGLLTGGQNALINRAILVLWRFVCGFALLITVLMPFLYLAVMILQSFESIFLGILFGLGLMSIVIVITSAAGIAVLSAANDKSINLMDVIRRMQGKWLRFIGFNLICYILLIIGALILSVVLGLVGIVIDEQSVLRSGFYVIITNTLGMVWTYFITLVGYYLCGLHEQPPSEQPIDT